MGSGCDRAERDAPEPLPVPRPAAPAPETAPEPAPPGPRAGVLVEPAGLAAGEAAGALRAARVELEPTPGGGWTGTVVWEGGVELTGALRAHPDAPEVDALCFWPDSGSAQRLPRFAEDQRTAWFCFEDAVRARARLGAAPREGVRVRLERYVYRWEATDVVNEGRLAGG